METNVVVARFTGYATVTDMRYRWDYGQKLKVEGIADLPDYFEVHFSNAPSVGTAKVWLGQNGVVDIPDEYLATGEPVYAWIFLHAGETDGETVYSILIPVKKRPKPVNDAPTPVQKSELDTAIAILQTASATATEQATIATGAATTATEAAETATGAATTATEAAETATSAATTATEAAETATSAVADVEAAATRAEQAADGAEASATDAQAAARSAELSAQTAQLAKSAAETAAANAEQSATDAGNYAGLAEAAEQDAQAAKTAAEASATAAAASETAAQTAQTAAEAAKDTAVANATTATTKAAEAAQSASSAADSETAAEAAATRAEQAAASLTVDSALSETSKNPVQNKVVTGAVADLRSATVEIQGEIADLKSHLEGYVTPEMFGAKGDGIADDTSAFQNMFENADYIFIPDKSYAISTVNVPNKDVVIDGVGTLLVKGSGLVFNAPLKRKEIRNIHFELDDDSGVCAMGFYGSSSTAPFNTLTIDNVTVKAASLSGKIGIDIQSENEALLSNVSLYGCALNVINSINPSIVNCVFRHSHEGIYNANTDTDSDRYGHACGLKVSNTTVLGCTIGIKSVQCDSVQIQSCMIDYNDYPVIILGADGPVIDNCYLSSRSGNTVIYVDKNNSDSGVLGGNGINAEKTSDSKITNCYVVMHDEALTNSAVVIKNGASHVISNVTVAYGGKSCIELQDVQNTLVTNCNLRSSISGAKALISYKNGALGDDGSNKYANINTALPIYVRNAQTDINTRSFITERRGSVIVDAQTNSTTVNTYIPQGIDYAIVYTNGLNLTYSENGTNLTITIPEHTKNLRINWIAFGKRTDSSFS